MLGSLTDNPIQDIYPCLFIFGEEHLSPIGRKEHADAIGHAFKKMRLKITASLNLTLTDVKKMDFREFLFYYSESVRMDKEKAARNQSKR